jgi:hypothetical protein
MSKQLKLQFRKLLKKAEFIHADLDYHEELVSDAKMQFNEAVAKTISELSPDDQQKIAEKDKQNQILHAERIKEAIRNSQIETEEKDEETLNDSTALTETDEVPDAGPIEEPEEGKAADLKKLFYQIAALTHPDKAKVNEVSEREATKLEKIFKHAKQAYDDSNWYILYSIALDLGLPTDPPSREHLEWIEDDIRQTMASISQIGALVAWMWYAGDEVVKQMALANYFAQMYGISLTIDLGAE